jgi:hypothetical protein
LAGFIALQLAAKQALKPKAKGGDLSTTPSKDAAAAAGGGTPNKAKGRRWSSATPGDEKVQCEVYDRNAHSAMPLVPMPARLNFLHACD